MTLVEIPYKPRVWAKPFHATFQRWAALVMHRRAGKSTGVLNHHQRAALSNEWETARLRHLEPKFTPAEVRELLENRRYGHIMPFLSQAKAVAWEPLKRIASVVPGAKPNESELSVKYPNGNIVRLFGADNPDTFRGQPFSGVSYDEYSQQPPNIHGEVVSKALADHLGYGIFCGTIKGKNHLYRTYEAAKTSPNWFSLWQDVDVTLATEEGATITAIRRSMQDDLEQIQQGLMTQAEFDQEWYLSPTAAIKGAYYGKELDAAIREKRITRVPYDPALPVYDVWDLGKGPQMAIGMYQRVGRNVQMIDCLQGTGSDGLPHLIQALQKKSYVWGKHFAPHDIRATEIGTGKTRLETAQALGWAFEVVPEIGVDDGINAARLMFPRLWIDEENCQQFVDALGQYRQEWDDKKGMFRDVPLHDWTSHHADQFRYAAVVEDQMTNERQSLNVAKLKPRAGGSQSWMGNVVFWGAILSGAFM